mgnify:CR=1 FL=1
MPIEALLKELTRSMPRLETRLCEPLSAHTSLRIGGPADAMVFPKSAKELTQILSISRQIGEKPIVIGNGTNLLAPDEPLRRLVVKTQGGVSGCFAGDDGTITAESGTLLSSLASLALKNSLTGLEFAQGIPGTLGGALVMNAGAYGGEIGNLVHATVCLNEQGQINTLTGYAALLPNVDCGGRALPNQRPRLTASTILWSRCETMEPARVRRID